MNVHIVGAGKVDKFTLFSAPISTSKTGRFLESLKIELAVFSEISSRKIGQYPILGTVWVRVGYSFGNSLGTYWERVWVLRLHRTQNKAPEKTLLTARMGSQTSPILGLPGDF